MRIPPVWKLVSGAFPDRQGRPAPLSAWGYGPDARSAEAAGRERLLRLAEFLRTGQTLERWYGYAQRPVREEVVESFGASADEDGPIAVVTRNGYGALILNAARMLFLDIDFQPGLASVLRRRLGGRCPFTQRLERLRQDLAAYPDGTFRIYRTAGGFRALCVNRPFDPGGRAAADLLRSTGADPAFSRLCKVQQCFRARLTPKPWRCGLARPTIRFPYRSSEEAAALRAWADDYHRVAARYATCRYAATVGSAPALDRFEPLIALHDDLTRALSGSSLA